MTYISLSETINIAEILIGALIALIIVFYLIKRNIIKFGTVVNKDEKGITIFDLNPDHPVTFKDNSGLWTMINGKMIREPETGNWSANLIIRDAFNTEREFILTENNFDLDKKQVYAILSGEETPLIIKDNKDNMDIKDIQLNNKDRIIELQKRMLLKKDDDIDNMSKDVSAQYERKRQLFNRKRTAGNTGGSPSTISDRGTDDVEDELDLGE